MCEEARCITADPVKDTTNNNSNTGVKCGSERCVTGEPCCNDSCGYCGDMCTMEYCGGNGNPFSV